ncbi:MAG: peptidylprolyl isomerase [Roseovarius sp.]
MTFHTRFLAACTLSLASFCATPLLAQDTPNADTVLVTIDGTDITLGHMIALRSNLPAHYDQLTDEVLFEGILDQLVQHTLLAQSLADGPSRQSALIIENETRAIAASEAINAVTSIDITDAQIQSAYEEAYLKTDPETEYSASHILVETEDEAKDLIQKLSDGADFAELAREFSTGPSGANGGALGWFGAGVMVEPFFDAVVALKAGGVSDPVQTQFGWHVIMLNETRDQSRPALEDVREQLEEELRQTAFDDFVSALEKRADINRADISMIDPALLKSKDLLEQ